MRKLYFGMFGVLLTVLISGQNVQATFSESIIQDAVSTLRQNSNSTPIPGICGGLASPLDERVLQYYAQEEHPFSCKLILYAEGYDIIGEPEGDGCRLIYRDGVPDSSIVVMCEQGSCTDIRPHTRCTTESVNISMSTGSSSTLLPEDSGYREYQCDGAEEVQCYFGYESESPTSSLFLQYSYNYNYNYNCVIRYRKTPVSKDQPKGWSSVTPRMNPPIGGRSKKGSWTPVPGSSASLQLGEQKHIPFDSSANAVMLDDANFQSTNRVVQPIVPTPFLSHSDVFDNFAKDTPLPEFPNIRLLLPEGSLGLQGRHPSLFSRLFTTLLPKKSHPSPVQDVIEGTPGALKTASEYLRSIPLMEVEYVPVEISVPVASLIEIRQRQDEWKAWISVVEESGVTIPHDLTSRVQQNIDALQSYVALQDSIRRYREHFPEYIHELLSTVEGINNFFRIEWVEENATRLETWYSIYANRLPALHMRIRYLAEHAASFASTCVVPACRMNVIPVRSDAHPWDMPDFGFIGDEEAVDREFSDLIRVLRLPDLTFDFSEISIHQIIKVPVLRIQEHRLALPGPPLFISQTLERDLPAITKALPKINPIHPPLFSLTFPKISLPDPSTDLLLVPKPFTESLDAWETYVSHQETILHQLDESGPLCDSSDTPSTFLISEVELLNSDRDPSVVRALNFIPTPFVYNPMQVLFVDDSLFPSPTLSWSFAKRSVISRNYFNPAYNYNSPYFSSLVNPDSCSDCSDRYVIRQRMELDHSWDSLQQNLLTAIDVWNAQVTFYSIVDRNELLRQDRDYSPHSGMNEHLPSRFP